MTNMRRFAPWTEGLSASLRQITTRQACSTCRAFSSWPCWSKSSHRRLTTMYHRWCPPNVMFVAWYTPWIYTCCVYIVIYIYIYLTPDNTYKPWWNSSYIIMYSRIHFYMIGKMDKPGMDDSSYIIHEKIALYTPWILEIYHDISPRKTVVKLEL